MITFGCFGLVSDFRLVLVVYVAVSFNLDSLFVCWGVLFYLVVLELSCLLFCFFECCRSWIIVVPGFNLALMLVIWVAGALFCFWFILICGGVGFGMYWFTVIYLGGVEGHGFVMCLWFAG